jgi:uncharacterized membrane protein
MILIDGIIIWIHLLAACIWVGGSIFIGLILAPMLKNIGNSVEERVGIMIKVGRRFNKFAFPSFIILILSGIYNSRFFFENPNNFFQSDYGILLFIKIILTVVTSISYIIHIKGFGKDIENKILGNNDPQYLKSIRSKIIDYGRLTVFLSIFILLFAALLDSGLKFS